MHELAITENVVAIALAEAEKHNASRVVTIRLRIGEMTHVDPTSVEFYLGLLAKDTLAAGAKLEAELVPIVAKCARCGSTFGVDGYDFKCPSCGTIDTEQVSGRELYVDSIEIE